MPQCSAKPTRIVAGNAVDRSVRFTFVVVDVVNLVDRVALAGLRLVRASR